MKKVKVLRTIETFYPNVTGPANQAFQISARLEKIGILSPVLTTNFKTPAVKNNANIEGISIKRFPVRLRFMQYTIAPGLKKQLLREDCDIIHAHNYRGYHTQAAFRAAKRRGIPFVISTHGGLLGYEQYLKGVNKLPYIIFDFFTRKKTALDADAVIVNSKNEHADALRYGVHKNKLHLIPSGVDVEKYLPKNKTDDKITVLFVGRITRNRNLEPIIKASAIVRKKRPDQKILFKIVGSEVKTSSTSKGGYLEDLKKLAYQLNVQDIVEFSGPLYDNILIECYRTADIFVYTSLSENFGQPILEAGAAGTPIICTNVGIAPEIIKNNINGFIVKGEPEEIAKRIIELFDKNKREIFGKITRGIVKKNFDWENILKKYVELYKSLLKKNK
jgi:glycosyltransferase involved in cell wall biosynthesis